MNNASSLHTGFSPALLALLLSSASPLVHAADIFKADNDHPLSAPGSWQGGALPTTTDRAVFPDFGTGPRTADIGAQITWGGLYAEGDWTVTGASTLRISNLHIVVTNGSFTVDTPYHITMNNLQNWTVGPGATLAFNLPISGNNTGSGIKTAGAGTVFLNAANTFLGNSDLSNDTLVINDPRAFGLGLLIPRGSQLHAARPGIVVPNDFYNPIPPASLALGGTNDLTFAGALAIPSGGRTLFNYSLSNTLTFAGTVAADYAITFKGNPDGTPNGAFAFTGPLTGAGNLSFVNFPGGTAVFAGDSAGFTGLVSFNTTSFNTDSLRLDYTAADTSKLGDAAALTLSADLELTGGTHPEVTGPVTVTGPVSVTRPSGAAFLAPASLAVNAVRSLLTLDADDLLSLPGLTPGTLLPYAAVRDAAGSLRPAAVSPAPDGLGGLFVRAAPATAAIPRLGGVIPDATAATVTITDGGSSGPVTPAAALTNRVGAIVSEASDAPVLIDLGGTTLHLGDGAGGGIFLARGAAPLTVSNGTLIAGRPGLGAATANILLVNNDPDAPLTFAAAIARNSSAASPLIKAGTGTVVIASSPGHTGGTAILEGILQIDQTGSLASAGAITLFQGARLLTRRNSGNYNLSNPVKGTGSLIVSNAPAAITLINSIGNTFSGGTTVHSGILRAQPAFATNFFPHLGRGPVTLAGGNLELLAIGESDNAAIAVSNAVTLAADASIRTARLSGDYTGLTFRLGALVFDGPRTLTLTGANGFALAFDAPAAGPASLVLAPGAALELPSFLEPPLRIANDGDLTLAAPQALTPGTLWSGTGTLHAAALSLAPSPAAYAAASNLPARIDGPLTLSHGATLAGSLTVSAIAFAPGSAYLWRPGDTLHITGDLALADLPAILENPVGIRLSGIPILTYTGAYTGPDEIIVSPTHLVRHDPDTRTLRLASRPLGTVIYIH